MLDPVDLIEFCAERMARHMVPRYVDLVDELPRTPTEKVEKAVLRDAGRHRDRLGSATRAVGLTRAPGGRRTGRVSGLADVAPGGSRTGDAERGRPRPRPSAAWTRRSGGDGLPASASTCSSRCSAVADERLDAVVARAGRST